jgi:hypothetical protein
MKDISFFSENTYLCIPNSKDPKVILAIGKGSYAKESFKLYNPFSRKAKVFKSVARFFFTYFNSFFRKIIELEVRENSEFIHFLNKKYDKKFTSSIYNATLKDKVVIQLQVDHKIFGYVKFPLNEIGINNVKNEINALRILSEKGIINFEMRSLEFKKVPFFILPELEGNIDRISDEDVLKTLEPFKKDASYTLNEHVRVREIKDFLRQKELSEELNVLNKNLKSSKNSYQEVYEHGDFAPWNIVKTKEGFTAFDFEYFTEKGLEYFDLIKYHFQIGRLLKGKNKEDLFNYVSQKIKINEITEMLTLFLLKEIMVALEQEKTYHFEKEMLNFINE